jgi:uncharacterized protein (TIGR00369 family)
MNEAPPPTPSPHRPPPAALARRGAEEQARIDAGLIEIFERQIRFNQVLGLKIVSVRPGDVRGSFDMRPELVGHFSYGRLHGGVISSVLDAMGGLSLMVALAERHPNDSALQVFHRFGRMGTIDLRIDYLRQGIGKRFVASSEVSRLGGRVGSTQMKLVNDDGTLIATGAAAYIVS